MYKCFDFSPNEDYSEYYEHGKNMYTSKESIIYSTLENYIGENGSIDGSKLQNDWFPDIKAHVFLSHSHIDEKLAISIAGWLNKNFDLDVFIDSCVWRHCDDLLNEINNSYCKIPDKENTYYLDKTNHSASHVYMMLANALNGIINNTECIIFLNTPNSIKSTTKEIIESKTTSPWIHSEILATKLLRITDISPQRKQQILQESGQPIFSNLNITYNEDLKHLIKLNDNVLKTWQKFNNHKSENALNHLYQIIGAS